MCGTWCAMESWQGKSYEGTSRRRAARRGPVVKRLSDQIENEECKGEVAMPIRACPDCMGRGKFWRAPNCRTLYEYVPVHGNDTSQTGVRMSELPEWEVCDLCGGSGKVLCSYEHGEDPDEWENECHVKALASEVVRLTADNAGLRADLDGEANWDLLCSIANRLTAITGAPTGMGLPEQVEHGLMAVALLMAEKNKE